MPYGVKANIRAPHRFMRMGALCWIANLNPGSSGERLEVIGLSRGGRKVLTWILAADLTDFRVGWVPERPTFIQKSTHRSAGQCFAHSFPTRENAETWASVLTQWSSNPVRSHAAAFGQSETRKP